MRGHAEIKSALQRAEEICVNPIILEELLAGFRRGGRLRKNQEELRMFLSSPRVHVLNLDEETAERYSLVLDSLWRAGTPIPSNDLWIAASAMQHGLRILTTDAHYQKVAQVVVDYVEPS
jgi:tRNA(fMet)-specific endonuclease VapC